MLPHGVQESQSPTSRKPSSFAEEVLSKATELGRPKGGLAPPSVAPPVQPDEDSGLPPPPDDDISHRPSTTSYADIDLPAPPPLEVVDVYDREMPVHYVVLYDYEATQPDDLTLVEGSSLLLLLERSDGWSQGINAQGQLGFFPHSYVRPLEHGEHTTMPSVRVLCKSIYLLACAVCARLLALWLTRNACSDWRVVAFRLTNPCPCPCALLGCCRLLCVVANAAHCPSVCSGLRLV
eukprot:m.385955 g.385955  ORF g.385955 m.385955 type:complete len:236 (+) comp56294_c0_seq7:154-861(+)